MKNVTRIGGVAAVAAALALTGCGGSPSGPATAEGQESGSDISSLISINEKPAADLEQGGKVTLPLGNIGPDFNGFSNSGNSSDNTSLMAPINPVGTSGGGIGGCWKVDFDGTHTPNKDFCESVESEVVDGKQTITIKVNEKATYNDGAPIDVKSFQNTWNILKSTEAGYDIVSPGSYPFVESVEAGSSDKEVIVKTSQPVYPLEALFFGLIHPAVNTPEIFNTGFTGEMHPEWMAGPFKVGQYDSAAQTVTLVQNEKWWGTKPVLESVTYRQLEASAQIAAFKNGEIDGVSANTIALYKQLDGTANSEVRRGQRLFAGGLNINAQRLADTAVREAIFTAVDREAIRNVRFNGLNWKEPSSGSMMLLPFSEYYQDNYPVTETGAEAAKKVLTDAGYTANAAGIMEKDGKPVTFKISNFGDDPTTLATTQTLQKQLQDAGMDVGIAQHGSAEFGKILGGREFDLSLSGYTVGADATDVVKQFYDSTTNENELGDAELDKKIADLASIEDNAERNKAAMDVEKEHMAKYFSMGVVFNGPQISFVRTGLANYGPSLFRSLNQVPDWTTIGWEKK
ncbi:ABC transporter family substrate-binding protein [Pseudarthrobacter sp. J75]|uniref:ABC transporter family substrate-binding protein n=1 Tax=unclassified Pseudarthrobacter TaxID=2647000 RepID=UPI002E7FCAA1|nr:MULTISPECIES: ABC transporter family substrate-binding protein [unclassified Pseudarthrobacter]MEE2523674.1 ABC transporter family substrate-binding protein [Pseudarthrobacter sp. J47]MEE2530065.1 ABC transporter family substrate-binding protein [Pseudarthrobacter sp. J75]MEE2570525.1 ABC transporter family substrate-binding protein [Pseudarthrobacter sp. J64]